MNKNIIVMNDWSTQGLAFTIWQKHCSCTDHYDSACCKNGWKIVLCSSRHLQKSEKNYAPMEGEALAIAWCLQKACNYLLGVKHFMLLTDCKPLINIFSEKALSSILNPRLLRIKQKPLSYNFTIKHIVGKNNTFTDTLSRYPVNNEEDEDITFAAETEISCILVY